VLEGVGAQPGYAALVEVEDLLTRKMRGHSSAGGPGGWQKAWEAPPELCRLWQNKEESTTSQEREVLPEHSL